VERISFSTRETQLGKGKAERGKIRGPEKRGGAKKKRCVEVKGGGVRGEGREE